MSSFSCGNDIFFKNARIRVSFGVSISTVPIHTSWITKSSWLSSPNISGKMIGILTKHTHNDMHRVCVCKHQPFSSPSALEIHKFLKEIIFTLETKGQSNIHHDLSRSRMLPLRPRSLKWVEMKNVDDGDDKIMSVLNPSLYSFHVHFVFC